MLKYTERLETVLKQFPLSKSDAIVVAGAWNRAVTHAIVTGLVCGGLIGAIITFGVMGGTL